MARRRQFVNNAETTLSASMTVGATSASVVDGSVFPAEGDFTIVINSELLLVTARSGNTLTVTRGVENSVASSHNANDTVRAILTRESLEDYAKENTWHGNTSPPLRVYDLADGSPGLVADFTWLNQGTATATDRDGRIVLRTPPNAGTQVRGLFQSAPTPPYEIIMGFSACGEAIATTQAGLAFRESSSGKIIGLRHELQGTVAIAKFDNVTTFNSLLGTATSWHFGQSVNWMKIEDDNTNIRFFVSVNGIDWIELNSEARGTFFTTAPNEVGFFTNPGTANNFDCLMEIFHFGEV